MTGLGSSFTRISSCPKFHLRRGFNENHEVLSESYEWFKFTRHKQNARDERSAGRLQPQRFKN